MNVPKIAQKGPYAVNLEKGKIIAWCRCGESATQPYCDGTHKATDFKPIVFTPEETKTAYLCGCKQTSNPPYCDRTHKKL